MATAAKTTVSIEKVTPELAAKWLAYNTKNRTLRQRAVDDLAGAIERGEWYLSNDALTFDVTGALLNGQHRLEAVVRAGVPCEFLIIRGADVNAQLIMDQGKKRNLADELRIEGLPSPLNLAAAVTWQWRLDNDLVRTSRRPTVIQGLGILREHDDLPEAVRWSMNRWHSRLHGAPSVAAVCYREFNSVDPDAAGAFFESLVEGIGLKHGSPILALRRQVESARIGSLQLFALTIKAWNAYLDGKQIQALMWRPVGKQPEAFPAIAGKK